MAWKKSTTTKHTCGGPAFGRLTAGCPRCDQLANGAAPVQWAKRDDSLSRAIMKHCCIQSKCSFVCTFGDW